MVTKVRVLPAAAALAATAMLPGPAEAAPRLVSYKCQADASAPQPVLQVRLDGAKATVAYDGQRYALERRPSSIGSKYGSAIAALIVDGSSAIFVAEDRAYATCVKDVSVASDR